MKQIAPLLLILLGLISACKQPESKTVPRTDHSEIDSSKVLVDSEQHNPQQSDLDPQEIDSIQKLIGYFQQRDIERIADHVRFPLKREYPIPDIQNRQEFIQRFSEVFDERLIRRIADSGINQWSEVGWRGIMLDDGVLWMANSDGVITAVNYQSDFEKKEIQKLIAQEKNGLHASLKNFEKPVYRIQTPNYLIRIDELAGEKFRYASWKAGEIEASEPDLLMNNGVLAFSGSGGNHVITFENGKFVYSIYRNHLREDGASEVLLVVEESGREILREEGILLKN